MKNAKELHWWKLTVATEGVLSAKLGGIRDIDFTLSAYDKDRRELVRIDETTVGGDEQLLDLGVFAWGLLSRRLEQEFGGEQPDAGIPACHETGAFRGT